MTTLNEVSSKLLEVDAKQDKEIAVLTHQVEDLQRVVKDLRDRIRKNEKWIAGAAAVIAAATFVIGIAVAVDSKEIDYGRNGSPQQEVVLQLPSS